MFAVMQGTVANMAAYTKKLWGDKPGPAPWINKSFMFAMGGTPLHAVGFMTDNAQQKDKMVWLLANGAKPSLKKAWMMGGSPLVALSMNAEADPACFDVLMEAGCDPNEVAKPWRMAKAIAGLLSLFKVLRPKKFSDADSFMMMASGGNPIHFASFIGNVRQLRALSPHTRARAHAKVRFLPGPRPCAILKPCGPPPPHRALLCSPCGRRRPVVCVCAIQISNIRKLSEHGASNDRKNRFGQLPIAVLEKKMPDSHAPELLGSAIVPPQEKLKAAGLAIALAAKLNKGARILPNQQTATAA